MPSHSPSPSPPPCEVTVVNPVFTTIPVGTDMTWTASGTNLDSVAWTTSPAGSPATGTGENFTTQWSAPGTKTITGSCDGTSKQATASVVAVDRVIVDGSNPEDQGPAYVCSGSVTLRAMPDPAGAGYPASNPKWSITSKPAGSSVPDPADGSATATITPDVTGTYVIKAECGTSSDTFTIEKVKVTAITVESGATQTNVTGAKNWAAVKKAGEYVIIKATTVPDVAGAWEEIVWTGGEAVPGGTKNKRRVSRGTSAKTNVKASCGATSKDLDVWILWGTVTITMTDTTPPNAVQFGMAYDGTENLGAKSYSGGTKAVGKVVPIGQLTPTDVKDVVKEGWKFKRDRIWRVCEDGAKSSIWDATWTVDTSDPGFQKLKPDADDKIYDRDAPNNLAGGATDCAEVWLNLRQWIEWNSAVASNQYVDWSWRSTWDDAGMPEEITLKTVSGTHLTLPTSCAACP